MTKPMYYVCHGPDVVHFFEADDSVKVVTGQPNIDTFDTENKATLRAIELGYVFSKSDEERTDGW